MNVLVFASVINTHKQTGNQGDLFGYHIAESEWFKRLCIEVLGKPINVIRAGVRCGAGPESCCTPTLYLVGSIAHLALARAKKAEAPSVICGIGCIKDATYRIPESKLHICGVRGAGTSRKLQNAPVVGDPALLLPLIMPSCTADDGSECQARHIGFVIHSVDRPYMSSCCPFAMQNLVDNYGEIVHLTRELRHCDYIVSTSLHGMIFAHALGIPAVCIAVGDRITGGDFKYDDYLSVYDDIHGEEHNRPLRRRVRVEQHDLSFTPEQWHDFVSVHAWKPTQQTLQMIQRNITIALRHALTCLVSPSLT